jgi:hypothetical protein
MRPIYLTRALVAAVANGIALDQNLAAAGDMVLAGSLVAGGVAILGAQRKVILTAGAGDNASATTFTIYGTDDQGHQIHESLAGPNSGVTDPVQSVLDYATVTRIAASQAFGAGVTVSAGTNGVGASVPVPLDQMIPQFNVMIATVLRSGAANWTVQYTFDNVFDAYDFSNTNIFLPGYVAGHPERIKWWDDADITAASADAKGSLVNPVKAVRLVTNSGTGSVEMAVIQQGTQ